MNNSLQVKNKNYDVLDLTKFILSFFVVAIHAEIFPQVLYPWLRIAVPIFFIISSFLFYSKMTDLTKEQQLASIKKYIKRNLILYFVWFVVLLPFTIVSRIEWFDNGVLNGIVYSIRGLVFGSTFRASWFIMAGIIAMTLVFFASKKIKASVLLVVAFLLYLVCCLVTGYNSIIMGTRLEVLYYISKYIFDGIATSFVSALIWVLIGKFIAENELRLSRFHLIIGIAVSMILLYFEHYLLMRYLDATQAGSCYVALVPFCTYVMLGIISLDKIKIKLTKILRNISTLIYVSHCAVLMCVSFVFKKIIEIDSKLAVFLVTSIIILMVSYILIKLSEKPKLKFLKKLW